MSPPARPRPAVADRLFPILAAGAGALLLGLGAGLTFFSDEWAFIETRALGDPGTWFAPHNEHWVTLQLLAYRLLVETVGLRTYLPYLGLLVALHLIVAALLYVHVRRSSGPWPALAAGGLFLVFGAGFENLFWAFQIGFVGSLALGLAGILVLDAQPLTARRALAGALLLLAGMLAQGGPGAVLTLAAGVELALDPRRRGRLVALVVPAGAYGLWYVLVGRVGVEAHQGPFGLGSLEVVLAIVASGWSTTIGALTGVGPAYGGFVGLGTAAAFGALAIRRGRLIVAPRLMAVVVAITALYTLIGLARSFVGPDVAQYTRYTYISAALLIIGLAAQLGRPHLDPPLARRVWLVAGAALLTMSLLWNVRLLVAGRDLFFERAELTRAFVTVALERPLPATTDPDRTLVIIPSPNAMERLVAAHGSPLGDALVPGAVPPIRPEILALARQVLAEGAEIPLPGARVSE